jgi:hypothetical protein
MRLTSSIARRSRAPSPPRSPSSARSAGSSVQIGIGGKDPALLVSRLASARPEGALGSCIGQLPFRKPRKVAAQSGVLRSASCRAWPMLRGANIANSTAAVRP